VIRSYEYPLFSRGSFMRTGKDRVQVSDMGVPVSLSDVRVRPGDILVGDDDGVVVIPHERETEILALAQKIADAENHIVDAVRGGARLDETRKALGYHLLQRT
jgi:regulator of RNase E activity RraA